ncbi:hypothetical protein JCM11251_003072 [Rhodosporidiobolus azoricus]
MAAVAPPLPSPPIPDSPGSLSSASSQSASDSSNGSNVPPPQPAPSPLPTYTSFDHHKVRFPPSSSRTASPAGSVVSTRTTSRPRGAGHQPSKSMSRLGGGPVSGGSSTSSSHRSSGSVSNSPSLRRREEAKSAMEREGGAGENANSRRLTRSRTLSFSSAQQAFVPSAPLLTASTSSASFQAFPSLEEEVKPTPTSLDRTPSNASTASTAPVPTRRPPRRTQTSLSVRSANTLRVPGPSAGRPGRVDVPTDYLEAKVVFLGGIGVGKTSLINVATYNRLLNSRSTIGASFHTKKMTVGDTRIHYQLWDSGGQERFKSMAPLYYRGALAAVLVYDMTDVESLEEIKYWLGELRKNMSPDLVILVVGTKSDLFGTYDTVPLENAQRSVALWLWELDHPGEPLPFGLSASASTKPSPPAQPPPLPPSRARASLTRSQTLNTPLSSAATFVPFPSITTTPAPLSAIDPPIDSLSSRPRQLSHSVTYTSISDSTLGAAGRSTQSAHSSTSAGAQSPRPTISLTSSLTMPDLSGYTLASLNLATPYPQARHHHDQHHHSNAHDSLALTASSAGMGRSSSGGAAPSSSSSAHLTQSHARSGSRHLNMNLMSLSGLAGRRQSHDERLRAEWVAKKEEEERVKREGEEWVQERIKECKVECVEVSATANVGIDDIFLSIASQLITRKAEIERQRVLRSRDSIILRDEDAVDTTKAGWCAC